MENDVVGLKEMYDINIRLNQPLSIGGRQYDINETILSFKTAEIAQLQESKSSKTARGGFNNNPLISWEIDKEATFGITHGLLSPVSWAILSNSKLNQTNYKSISYKEELDVIEDDDYWFVDLKFNPNNINEKFGVQGNPDGEQLPMGRRKQLTLKPLPPRQDKFIFCYDMETGQRIMKFEIHENRIIFFANHRKIMVDYTFDYDDEIRQIDVGNRLFNGYLNLTGKMTVKDYRTGEPKTAILEIPKLKLNSSLSMKLGKYYDNPVVSDFYFVGYPDENQNICKLTFLDTELTGEYL